MTDLSPITLIVHLDIEKARLEEFLKIVAAHGENSLRNESGCLRFEVLVPKDPRAHVILVETYSDQTALESHWNSEHMAEYRKRIDGIIINRTLYRCDL